MSESPEIVYGRLLESAHISGYTFERVCSELEWLLEDGRWRQVGPGYDDINVFLKSIDLSAFNLGENRPKLVKKIKRLEESASNRAIAKAIGVDESTIRYDVNDGKKKPAGNPAPTPAMHTTDHAKGGEPAGNPAAWFSDDNVAEHAKKAAKRKAKDAEREQKRDQNRVLVNGTTPLSTDPDVRYPTIVIDPPWDWGDEGDVEQFGRARPTYHTMSHEEIKALPVGIQAGGDAHIYLWITNRSLYKGFDLLDAWGFRYITTLTWCKPRFGMGNYFRGQTEHVLFGVRGSLPLLRRDRGTWFVADRNGQHSGKPAEFYQLVEECSPGPWLEIFGRGSRAGWAQWGAEAE